MPELRTVIKKTAGGRLYLGGGKFVSFCSDLVSGLKAVGFSRAAAAMLGLAGPLAVGSMLGRPRTFIIMSLGGLALSGSGRDSDLSDQFKGVLYSLVAGGAAVFTGWHLSDPGWPSMVLIPFMAGVVGLLGGLSRPLARASVIFILYTIISANIGVPAAHPLALALLFALGGAGEAGLYLLFRRIGSFFRPPLPSAAIPKPRYAAKQYIRRWVRSLGRLSGWQYALRITICLAAAQVFAWLWPHHHGYWVSVTVVIVVQRDLQTAHARAWRRALGTALGVLLTSLFILGSYPEAATIAAIAILAGARPILMETNYTAYAAVMTPLVILLLDFGQTPSWGPVLDRFLATLVGCILALTLGYLYWSRLTGGPITPPPPKGETRRG